VTKLGRLVKEGKIKSLEEIYLFSLAVKEYQIVDFFLGPKLKDEVMKIMPVQKQSAAGQRTRFKAFVAVGDYNGHVGLGVKCASEVATAIRGAIIMAKISVVPIRRGYWGKNVGLPHTIPNKVTGACGSVRIRLIPAPRGTGLVASPVPKKLLAMAGIEDVYTSSKGHTRTMGNFGRQFSSRCPKLTGTSPQSCGSRLFSLQLHTRPIQIFCQRRYHNSSHHPPTYIREHTFHDQ